MGLEYLSLFIRFSFSQPRSSGGVIVVVGGGGGGSTSPNVDLLPCVLAEKTAAIESVVM